MMAGRLRVADMGGAVICRAFKFGESYVQRGMPDITREQLQRMPAANLNALIDKGFLSPYPMRPAGERSTEGMDRHVVSLGFGRFDVVEGKKLNDEPLSKEAAHALAGKELQAPQADPPRAPKRRSRN